MSRTVNRALSVLCLVLTVSVALAPAALSETITLNSGGGYAFGQNDPQWRYLGGTATNPLSGAPFTGGDFAAALSGPQSVVVAPYGSFWLASLACDPQAQWISVDANRGPQTALFGTRFTVETCCVARATLTFCWAADDNIGDQLYGGANPMGVYYNGNVLPITGGSYATENSAVVDVTGMVVCDKLNSIFVYNRDAAAVVSGTMFSITLDIIECAVKTEQSTWGSIKALYR